MAQAKKSSSKEKILSVTKLYAADGKRTKKTCPKCGPGYFLAQHKDRISCGHCQYMEKIKA